MFALARELLSFPGVWSASFVCTAVGWGAAGYLAYRLTLAALRARWARHAYPQVRPAPVTSEWQSRCRALLVGHAVGDALGLPAESLPRWLTRIRYPGGPRMRRGLVRLSRRSGEVSDDTQLAIAVARSIMPDGSYCHERFVDELRTWSYAGLGAGRACALAARRARRGSTVGPPPSEGNGVAIRMAPLAIAMARRDDDALRDAVALNGASTHGSDAAVRAGRFVALLTREALRRPPGAFARAAELVDAVRRAADGAQLRLMPPEPDQLATDAALARFLRHNGTSGHVDQTIPAVVAVLLRHRLDFAGAMRSICCAGGDTDSIGAIVGGIIGAQVGLERLPRSWSDTVQHRDYLCWLADRLSAPGPRRRRLGRVVVIDGDIATREVDAVVNAWNRNLVPPWLLIPRGVSGAIRRAGGGDAIRQIGRRAPLPLGGSAETGAGRLPCRWVVHADGIDLGWSATADSVRAATRSALLLARWLGARSVALPLIGAGSGGLDPAVAETILIGEMEDHIGAFDQLELVVPGGLTTAVGTLYHSGRCREGRRSISRGPTGSRSTGDSAPAAWASSTRRSTGNATPGSRSRPCASSTRSSSTC